MGKIISFIFLLLIPYITWSQDGLYTYFDGPKQDTIFSIYNCDPYILGAVGDEIVTQFKNKELIIGNYAFETYGATILGEVFMYYHRKQILIDYYVDEIYYENGFMYKANRIPKPIN